jgi:hypothetical protein
MKRDEEKRAKVFQNLLDTTFFSEISWPKVEKDTGFRIYSFKKRSSNDLKNVPSWRIIKCLKMYLILEQERIMGKRPADFWDKLLEST